MPSSVSLRPEAGAAGAAAFGQDMAIKLRVISDHYRELGEHRSRVFGVNGGTVGRAADNDWILPDAKRLISGHHCSIEYRGGVYWLRDTSTNGVFVNETEEPVSDTGPVALKDGDRLRMGDYEILVSIDDRIDFLQTRAEAEPGAAQLEPDIGASLNIDSLFSGRDPGESGSIPVGNAYALRARGILPQDQRGDGTDPVPDEPPPPPMTTPPPEWAVRTRPVTREELKAAVERRRTRMSPRETPLHQKAESWSDLDSALQAFCRGAGLEPDSLSADARAVLPLLAGQLLREFVVGLADIAQGRESTGTGDASRSGGAATGALAAMGDAEQSLRRLLESHGRIQGGAVDTLRDALRDIKDHEIAMHQATEAALRVLLEQFDPARLERQLEQGRKAKNVPGIDVRAQYWEHYGKLYRLLQQRMGNGLPLPFAEAFERAYLAARAQLKGRNGGGR